MVYKDSDSLVSNPSHGMVLRSSCSMHCSANDACHAHHNHERSAKIEAVGLFKQELDHSVIVKTSVQEVKNFRSTKAYRGSKSVSKKISDYSEQHQKRISQEYDYSEVSERSVSCVKSDTFGYRNVNASQGAELAVTNNSHSDIRNTFGEYVISPTVNYNQMARTVYRKGIESFSHTVASEAPDTPELMPTRLFTENVLCSTRNGEEYCSQSFVNEDWGIRERNNNRHAVRFTETSSGKFSDNSKAHLCRTSASEHEGYSEDECDDSISTRTTLSDTEQHQTGSFRYLLFLRKYLYFGLSKPTHYDFENLSRISTFGKKKAIMLLLLPLLIWFLFGALKEEDSLLHLTKPIVRPFGTFYTYLLSVMYARNKSDNAFLVKKVAKKEDFFESIWGLSSDLISSFIPRDYTFETVQSKPFRFEDTESTEHFISNAPPPHSPPQSPILPSASSMSREEMESLIREIIRDEVTFQVSIANQQGNAWTTHEVNKLQKEISSFQSEFKGVVDVVKSMEMSNKLQMSLDTEKLNQKQEEELSQIKKKFEDLETKLVVFNSFLESAKNCCRNQTELTSVEAYLTSVLLSMTEEDGSNVNPNVKPFRDWLHSKFSNTQKTSEDLKSLKSTIKSDSESTKTMVMDLVKQHVEKVKHELIIDTSKVIQSLEQSGVLSATDVQRMIKEAILMYDADKTGETDYALESGGGSVVNTRCSETYSERSPKITIFGIPFWSNPSSPRNSIKPDLHPGECWAFKGSQGYLVIQLAATIRPTAFVIEHIPKSISPTGEISSAPKDFSVWGLSTEKDTEGKLLGKYTYDVNGEPLQYFPVQEDDGSFYSFVELKIHSNHGEIAYTCLYRFRVHGSRY